MRSVDGDIRCPPPAPLIPSSAERGRARVGALTTATITLVLWLLCLAPSHAEPASPTEHQIQTAIQQLKADPNLASERSEKRLKWREGETQGSMSAPDWLGEFLYWFAQSVRWVMWTVIAILVIALAVLIILRLKNLERAPRGASLEVPTHVRDLDIRPESLPDDIGATALELWNQGERRAALALLYRGLLSRLVHVHSVPIKASSTEGDCLQMVAHHLPEHRVVYATQLVHVWQRAVYGARDPDSDEVRSLCVGFDAAVSPAPARSA